MVVPYEIAVTNAFLFTYPGSRLDVSRPLGVCWSLESILIISIVTMKDAGVSLDAGARLSIQ